MHVTPLHLCASEATAPPVPAAGCQGLLDADAGLAAGMARCRFLVLDEADRVLDSTFEDDLRWG